MTTQFIVWILLVVLRIGLNTAPPTKSYSKCLVSSTSDTRNSGYFSYPLDLFASGEIHLDNSEKYLVSLQLLNSLFLMVPYIFTSLNCSTLKRNHICSLDQAPPCPIDKEFVALATAATTNWMKDAYLCDFKKGLENSGNPEDQMNILVMGGSVTQGAWARGCICKSSDSCIISEDLRQCLESSDENHCCSWPRQLHRWIQSKTRAKVNFISYAIGGSTSSTALRLYVDKLPKLSLLDLVFLDYSVNDACEMWGGNDAMTFNEVEHGMEWLIRQLLLIYRHSRPKLVLLNSMPAVFHGGYQYTTAYENLARHYSIPLWSYDIVAQSETMMKKTAVAKVLRWEDNCQECGVHPPWMVHLYTADLYAAIIEEEFNRCPSPTSPSISSEVKIDALVLPSPLTGYDGIHLCDRDSPRYLDISAEDVVRNNHHKHIGKYSGGWRAVEDRYQKWGWIDEFPSDSSPDQSMYFHLRESDHLYESKKDLLLRVAYLKTYKNTGKFDVYICGMFLQSIDTCWGDPKKKWSTAEVSFIPLSGGIPSDCNHDPSPSIQFRHVRVGNATKTIEEGCDRRYEKVSVISVSVCNAFDIHAS